MKKEKKTNWKKIKIEELNNLTYHKWWRARAKELRRFIEKVVAQSYQEGFEAGQHEATSQYKKDMEDAYEKGRRDVKEEMKEKFKRYNRLLKEIDKL